MRRGPAHGATLMVNDRPTKENEMVKIIVRTKTQLISPKQNPVHFMFNNTNPGKDNKPQNTPRPLAFS